jgi:hypothetical protein
MLPKQPFSVDFVASAGISSPSISAAVLTRCSLLGDWQAMGSQAK